MTCPYGHEVSAVRCSPEIGAQRTSFVYFCPGCYFAAVLGPREAQKMADGYDAMTRRQKRAWRKAWKAR